MIAKHKAVVLIPHGNIVQMFFREAMTMGVPVYIPDGQFLIRQPYLWWISRMDGSLTEKAKQIMYSPPRPAELVGREPHEYQPWVWKYPDGPERLAASIYWMRFLDYFLWPGVRQFSSVADLLHG